MTMLNEGGLTISPRSCGHHSVPTITIRTLDNYLVITTTAVFFGHLITISGLPCQLPTSRVNGEAGERLQVTPIPTAFSSKELLGGIGILCSAVSSHSAHLPALCSTHLWLLPTNSQLWPTACMLGAVLVSLPMLRPCEVLA